MTLTLPTDSYGHQAGADQRLLIGNGLRIRKAAGRERQQALHSGGVQQTDGRNSPRFKAVVNV